MASIRKEMKKINRKKNAIVKRLEAYKNDLSCFGEMKRASFLLDLTLLSIIKMEIRDAGRQKRQYG